MKKFSVTIEGIAPLLQARHLPRGEEEAGKKKAKEKTDKELFNEHAYKNSKGKFYQPSEMIEAAMTKAATNFKLEGKKTYKDVMNGGIIVDPVEMIHKNQKTEMDSLWGRNKSTGGAVWVVRPRFDKWSVDFTITLLQDERVSPKMLRDILEYAGLYVGIGAWRPKFGRFEIKKFVEVTK